MERSCPASFIASHLEVAFGDWFPAGCLGTRRDGCRVVGRTLFGRPPYCALLQCAWVGGDGLDRFEAGLFGGEHSASATWVLVSIPPGFEWVKPVFGQVREGCEPYAVRSIFRGAAHLGGRQQALETTGGPRRRCAGRDHFGEIASQLLGVGGPFAVWPCAV
jgi:hypothetical protein